MERNLDNDYHLTKTDSLDELRRLRKVIEAAFFCDGESDSEHAWNRFVHCNTFKVELAKLAGKTVKPLLVSTAAIAPGLAPKTKILNGDGKVEASSTIGMT
ncbi:hypothetical protein FHL15_005850 [Xylaria flabelliformis]|uniref:Uncharacterized protein n=1 Tax=Xylaria flabelliformis TaxID=2512241 RepID=A0A553HZA4_9PEZI|nr:hypothetical protein FHL15_005850 [Xylaria flabelliformis]